MALEIPSFTHSTEIEIDTKSEITLGGASTGAVIELPDQPRLFHPDETNPDQTALDI